MILLPLSKCPEFRPAAGGGGRGGSTESAAARGGDGLARVRQTTEAQQQVAHRLAHQRELPSVPFGGQTDRPWQHHGAVAQVAGREPRSGCAGKRQKNWAVVRRPLVLFSMLGAIPGLRFEEFGKKDPRIGLHLLGRTGAAREFCGRAFERFARAG